MSWPFHSVIHRRCCPLAVAYASMLFEIGYDKLVNDAHAMDTQSHCLRSLVEPAAESYFSARRSVGRHLHTRLNAACDLKSSRTYMGIDALWLKLINQAYTRARCCRSSSRTRRSWMPGLLRWSASLPEKVRRLRWQAAVAPAPVAAKFIPRSDAFAVGATVWINALAARPELNDTMAILNNVEEQVALPAGEMTALLAFIGKPAGDERSIALLGLCYRLLMQKHRPEMLEWNEKKTGWWGKARSGSSALRAGLARSRRCEVARELGLTAIMVLWGVSQFYDCISDHHRSCG
jgi:hypothetical protein